LQNRPELLAAIKQPSTAGSFHVTAMLFFSTAVATPHMFYMIFHENNNPKALTMASWALPLYLLIMMSPVLPILWAGLQAGSTTPIGYFPLSLGTSYGSELITLVGFLGGLSAASGLIIVITLALSNMCLNHLVLPIYQPTARNDIYRWLLWKRRALIAALIWTGFFFYYMPDDTLRASPSGNSSYIASLQFMPAILAMLYWPRGNKQGFIAGLTTGMMIWAIFLMLPATLGIDLIPSWDLSTREVITLSLASNIIVFALSSLLTSTSEDELASADVCALDTVRRRNRTGLVARSPDEFIAKLTKPLGERTATREVLQAMRD